MNVNDIAHLDLLQLATRLDEDQATSDEALSGKWRSIVELMSTRVGLADRASVAGHEMLLYRAYDSAVSTGQRMGELDGREGTIRRVNMLVLLASLSDRSGRAELLAKAQELVVSRLPMSLDQARSKSTDWRALPLEEMRQLRYAKNLLRPFRSSEASNAQLVEAGPLEAWLELLPSLP